MKMSKATKWSVAVLSVVMSAGIATQTLADNYQTHANYSAIEYARVTDTRPIFQTVEQRVPQERCWVQTVREETKTQARNTPSTTGTILGGVIGGAVGHAVGSGKKNKKLGAVVGTMLGMSIAADASRRNQAHASTQVNYRDVERCEVSHRVETHQELIGYDVTYRYQGQEFTTRMDRDPGEKIKVAVHVQPILD